MRSFIYILKHPFTKEVIYVGKANDSRHRYYQHTSLHRQKKLKTNISQWLVSILSTGKKPIMEIIEEVEKNWQEREIYWIEYYIHKGCQLQNTAKGGSRGMTGLKYSDCKNSKKVYALNEDLSVVKIFNSTTEANDKEGYLSSAISYAVKNRTRYKTLLWCYEEGLKDFKPSVHRATKVINIIQYTLDGKEVERYDNLKELTNKTGFNSRNIRTVIRGKRPFAHGYIWKSLNL